MDFKGVLVGLGNPGSQYENTRHNTGFLFVDRLIDLGHREGEVRDDNGRRFDCEMWRVTLDLLGGTWLLVKPQTFMNLSGQCVQPLLAWHRMTPSDLVVVHDELDLPPGSLRFKFGGGNAGHNGLKSINQQLGTPNFYRLRVGIGHPEHRGQVSDWVLSRMREPDLSLWEDALDAGVDVLATFVKRGLEQAVAKANRESRRIASHAEGAGEAG